MLYLSRLSLDPRSRQARAELADPYQMHRTLAKAFGEGDQPQRAARCLFRAEDDGPGLRVLVQSCTAPDWTLLTAPPDYWAAPSQVKPFAPQLTAGQALAFRLRANPTVRRDGVRLGLYHEDEQRAWLERKAAENGFVLGAVSLRAPDPSRCRMQDRRAVFSAAQFDGVLRVTDPEALLAALTGGIGAGKGFGFGLLSLAPVK